MNTRVLWKELRYEFLKLIRVPRFTMMTIGLPLMFYVIYAVVIFKTRRMGSVHASSYMLATFGTFGVLGVCLFGIAFHLANERELGWFDLRQASPASPSAYLAAKLVIAAVFGLIEVSLMIAIGAMFAGVRLPVLDALRLLAILVAGAVPFGALALALGYVAKADSAPALLNLIYLPMAFLSGLWMPLEMLPSGLQHAAAAMPAYHVSRLALGVLGADHTSVWWGHWEALAGFTALFLGLARLGYGLEQRRQGA